MALPEITIASFDRAVILACDPALEAGRMRMLSTALEDAGYSVVVLGRADLLAGQPQRVGQIAIEVVPGVERPQPTRIRLGLRRMPGLRPPHSTRDEDLERALGERLEDSPNSVFFALDPLALSLAQQAARRIQSRGTRTMLGYDRSKRPDAGSGLDQRELAAIGDVAFGTAASDRLANDGRWPETLRGRVPTIYSAPVGLASAHAMARSLAAKVERRAAPPVGIFLPSGLTTAQAALLAQARRLIAPVRSLVLGHPRDASILRRGARMVAGLRVDAVPPEDEVARLVPRLALVVCPSVWTAGSAPSSAAVAGAAHGVGLVTSRSVAGELPGATPVDAPSAQALAAAIKEAMRSSRSPLPTSELRARFDHKRRVTAFKQCAAADEVRRLAIGPRNGNGQAWAWAQALRRRSALPVEVFTARYATGRLAMTHDSDISIPLDDWKSREWQIWWAHRLQTRFSHVLIEQGLTACGWLNGRDFFDDLPAMLASGLKVGLVFRGSEIRDPAGHAAREPWSPFRDPDNPLTTQLQSRFEAARREVETVDIPKFVTTMDLLDDVPGAVWLPQVLDAQEWRQGPPIFQRVRPVVLHAPSRTDQMKGSHWVDEACQPLHDAGVIEYQRLRGVPFAEMPDRIREADVVIDQLALGSYGVLALQAMASERLVIGRVSERVRSRLSDPIPVLDAEPPAVRQVLEEALAAREDSRNLATSGREYVLRYHSGEESADRLLRGLVNT